MQCLYCAHYRVVCAAPVAAPAMPVVQEGRPVNAEAEPHAVPLQQLDPASVEKCAVGLDVVGDLLTPLCCVTGDLIERSLKKVPTGREGLARVPDERQLWLQQRAGAHFVSDGAQGLCAHAPRHLSIRQVAIVAVDVAERRRLDDDQLLGRARVGAP